jgi:LysM domain
VLLGANFRKVTDFNFGYEPITGNYLTGSPGSHTVSSGDTLKSIAQIYYGDSALWYRIADANSLSGDADLRVGQVISVPDRVGTVNNNSTTFKPYDPSKITGDTAPAVASTVKGCGVLGIIVMVIIALVVTWMTWGMSGGAEWSLVAGAVAGSVASQAVGVAFGIIDKFSWQQVALAAISAGIAQGLDFGVLAGSGLPETIVRAAIGSALTQGIAVVTGLQPKFEWRAVAAAAVTAAVGWGISTGLGITNPDGSANLDFKNQDFGQRAIAYAIRGFATTVTRTIIDGGKVTGAQLAANVFGEAVGNGFGDQIQRTFETAKVIDPEYQIYEQNKKWEQARNSTHVADPSSRPSTYMFDGIRQPGLGLVAGSKHELQWRDPEVGLSIPYADGGGEEVSGDRPISWTNALYLNDLDLQRDIQAYERRQSRRLQEIRDSNAGRSGPESAAAEAKTVGVDRNDPRQGRGYGANFQTEVPVPGGNDRPAVGSTDMFFVTEGGRGTFQKDGESASMFAKNTVIAGGRFAAGIADTIVRAPQYALILDLIDPARPLRQHTFTDMLPYATQGWRDNSLFADLVFGMALPALSVRSGVGANKVPLSYDISKWKSYDLPSDGTFVRTITRDQYLDLRAGREFSFAGKATNDFPSGMGFIGSAEEVRGITTRLGYKSALKLDYEPRFLLEFQLKDLGGLQNALRAPYSEFVPGGKTGAGYAEWNLPGISTGNLVNPKLRVLK